MAAVGGHKGRGIGGGMELGERDRSCVVVLAVGVRVGVGPRWQHSPAHCTGELLQINLFKIARLK